MPETKELLRPVRIDYTCDACGKGQMRSDGIVLTSYPPQYVHSCNKCDARKTFNVRYPRVAFELEDGWGNWHPVE